MPAVTKRRTAGSPLGVRAASWTPLTAQVSRSASAEAAALAVLPEDSPSVIWRAAHVTTIPMEILKESPTIRATHLLRAIQQMAILRR